jgi:phenylacetate-CoA ligase
VTLGEFRAGHPADWELQSTLPGIAWPAVPGRDGATVLSLLFQLENSQWFPANRLLERQLSQIEVVLKYAHANVSWYRDRWGDAYDPARRLTMERFCALPELTRRELQGNFEALKSADIPAAHGATGEARSSGSTGTPVRVLKTQLTAMLWNVITLRDHIWHRRDLRGKLAAIRHGVAEGEFGNWGPATSDLAETGPSVVLGVRSDVEAQLSWLERHQPDYLMTYPSILRELALLSIARGVRLTNLREVRTFGELLSPETRALCREAWDVPATDVYSTEEAGYLALQCPQHEHYHVQSEGVLVEILDEQGRPCAPGQVGRVVVTSLHNFAMPLIRYELGDYAEFGEACPCGRGLPVLKRIAGRVRNTLVTASGSRYWPTFGARGLSEIAPVLQSQFVQKEFDLIEARLVTAVRPTSGQEEQMRKHVLTRLPAGFRLSFVYCDRISRSAGGKFEDFISEVTVASRT